MNDEAAFHAAYAALGSGGDLLTDEQRKGMAYAMAMEGWHCYQHVPAQRLGTGGRDGEAGRPRKYPWATMQAWQSVLIETDKPASVRNSLSAWRRKHDPNAQFRTRLTENGVEVTRVARCVGSSL